MKCDYCGKSVDGLPHKCKFCGRVHCYKHLQPENHNCKGLPPHKWSTVITKLKPVKIEELDKEPVSEPIGELTHHKSPKNQKKLKFSEKIKGHFLDKYGDLLSWLKRREHHPYDFESRFNYLLTTVLIFVIAVVGFSIFYSNAQKLNEVNLWVIKLGGVLILISLFFAIKYGWRIIREIFNLFERQRNWLKYLVILIVLILLWQAYTHKTEVLNPAFEVYNKTNFSLFMPIGFGNFTLSDSSSNSNNDFIGGVKDFTKGIIDPKSQIDIRELEKEIHRLINIRRTNNELRPLVWDDTIALITREHSEDMVRRNFFSHDNPSGEDPTGRGKRHGYNCMKDYGSYYTEGLAENIGQTPIYSDVLGCGSTTSLQSLAECIVDGWMTSQGHRENILTSTYTKTGIGVAYSENNNAYSTQNFC